VELTLEFLNLDSPLTLVLEPGARGTIRMTLERRMSVRWVYMVAFDPVAVVEPSEVTKAVDVERIMLGMQVLAMGAAGDFLEQHAFDGIGKTWRTPEGAPAMKGFAGSQLRLDVLNRGTTTAHVRVSAAGVSW